MKNCTRTYIGACLATLFLLLLMAAGLLAASKQNPPTVPQGQKINMTEVLKLPGRVLERGSNTQPVGLLGLTTYLIEEVTLPQPTDVEIRGQTKRVTSVYRVTIFGGPFPVMALPYSITIGEEAVGWKIGDQAISWAFEQKNLDAITAFTFDRSLFKQGATLSVCKAGCIELPEKLKLKEAKDDEQ